MKAIMIMFDSLNRHLLPPYGCEWTHAPNFERLAQKSLTFTKSYIGSMPCMPARRELHTGRYNFLHRSWGPLEPFDDSMPQLLDENGIYSHLVTDHYHYFEDGAGGSYHNRYSSYEFVRGQEGDFWKGQVDPPEVPEQTSRETNHHPRMWVQDWINRSYMPTPEEQSQHKVFDLGLEFLHTNKDADNWYLQIETFDPHEPFFSHQKHKDLYPHEYEGPHFDWPPYAKVSEPPEQVEHGRYEYAALLSMCDEQLGRVLDVMDEHDLWRDTMLIVCTDHGYLLGEHDWWAKNKMPWYNYLANTPLFIWDPRSGGRGEMRDSVVQLIDIPATLLEYFGVARPEDMQGKVLKETIADDTPVRREGLFGAFGSHVNYTDGRRVYMRAPTPENTPLYEYTLMPTHLRSRFCVEELQETELAPPFEFTKGCPVMKIEGEVWAGAGDFKTLLYDVASDPGQEHPLEDAATEAEVVGRMIRLMIDTDAPIEQYRRLGLTEAFEAVATDPRPEEG
ncbi:MAG: sulfatase [Trueperaceae bacterium]|nr:MAG: sulfatase [Trueperaceae bacterium]